MDKPRTDERRYRSRSPQAKRQRDYEIARKNNQTPASQRIYISNVPFESKWQNIKDLFQEKIGDVMFVEMFNDEKGQPRGCGIVEFKRPECVDEAVEKMHRFEIKDRKIIVQRDKDCVRDSCGRIINERSGGGGGGGSSSRNGDRDRERERDRERDDRRDSRGWPDDRRRAPSPLPASYPEPSSSGEVHETYGLRSEFLRSLGIEPPLVPTIFIANLSFNVDEENLRDVFSMSGTVRSINISRDKKGQSRGFAVVEFEHPVEAVQAIMMFNNMAYFDRRMMVKLDRKQAREMEERGPSSVRNSSLPEGLSSIGVGLGSHGQPAQFSTMGRSSGSSLLPAGAASSVLDPVGAAGTNPLGTIVAQQLLLAQLAAGLGVGGLGQLQALAGLTGTGAGAGLGLGLGLGTGVGAGAGGSSGAGSSRGMGSKEGSSSGGSSEDAIKRMLRSTDSLLAGKSMTSQSMSERPESSRQYSSRYSSPPRSSRDLDSKSYSRSSDQTHSAAANQGSASVSTRKQIVIFRNLPTQLSYEDLKTLASRAGEVVGVEVSGRGAGIVKFASEEAASRAVRILDRTRVHQQIVECYVY